MDHAVEVHVDHPLPVVEGEVLDGTAHADAGVVEDEVESVAVDGEPADGRPRRPPRRSRLTGPLSPRGCRPRRPSKLELDRESSSATAFAASPSMSVTSTQAPRDTSSVASAAPMPEPAPVTMADAPEEVGALAFRLLTRTHQSLHLLRSSARRSRPARSLVSALACRCVCLTVTLPTPLVAMTTPLPTRPQRAPGLPPTARLRPGRQPRPPRPRLRGPPRTLPGSAHGGIGGHRSKATTAKQHGGPLPARPETPRRPTGGGAEPATVPGPEGRPWFRRGRGHRGLYDRSPPTSERAWSPVSRAASWLFTKPEIILGALGAPDPVEVDGRVLNRSVQALLQLAARLPGAEAGALNADTDPVVARARMRQAAKFLMPLRTDVYSFGRVIPGPEGSPPVPVRIYRRFGAAAALPPAPLAPGHRLLPRWRMGDRRPRVLRAVLPAAGRRDRLRGGVGRLPAGTRAPLPRRGGRCAGRLPVGPPEHRRARCRPRPGGGHGRQRRRQPGRSGGPPHQDGRPRCG